MIRKLENGDLVGVIRWECEGLLMCREWDRILWMVGLQRISNGLVKDKRLGSKGYVVGCFSQLFVTNK